MHPTACLAALALSCPALPAQVCEPTANFQPIGLPIGSGFGSGLALDGDLVAIGARNHPGTGYQSGAVLLMDAVTGAPLEFIAAADGAAQDQLGTSIALWNGHVLAGAPGDDDVGLNTGSVLIADAGAGSAQSRLRPSPVSSNTFFGWCLAVDGDRLLVGAPADGPSGSKFGAAYLFDLNTGQQLFRLTATDGAVGDQFGISVDLHGDLAVVGANFRAGSRGAAYLFDLQTGAQIARLVPDPSELPAQFGGSVAISDNRLLVGAAFGGQVGFSGAAYLYTLPDLNLVQRISAPDPIDFDNFGVAVALEGALAAVGRIDNGSTSSGKGSLYLFDAGGGQPLVQLEPSPVPPFSLYGGEVVMDAGRALVGSEFSDGDPVYAFSTETSSWADLGQGLAPGGSEPARLNGCGLLDLGGNVRLDLSGAGANQATVLVVGATELQVPLAGGVLVPTPDLLISGLVTNDQGALTLESPIGTAVPLLTERYAQAWSVDGNGILSASNAVRARHCQEP